MAEIIKCDNRDLDALQLISKQTYLESFSNIFKEKDICAYIKEKYSKEQLAKELSNKENSFSFCKLDDKIAGYLLINHHDSISLKLERIYVLNQFQGHGFGRILMQKAIDECSKTHKSELLLDVLSKNIKAINFYEKQGFQVVGDAMTKIGEEAATLLVMQKTI